MNPAVKAAYRIEMTRAQKARVAGDLDVAFAALERAHILGQRFLLPHITTHLQMLAIGWRRGDAREVVGQVMRLLATVPGFVLGWIPQGNTGGANVSALKPMPLPSDLQPLLTFSVWRDVSLRLLIAAGIAAAALVGQG